MSGVHCSRRPILRITWLGLLLALLGATECEELFELQFVSIDGPAEITFTKAQTVTITASALEGEGLTVEQVRFYRDDALASTDRTAPYTHAWPITADDNGPHRFYAEALYRYGDGKTELLQSEEVTYEVAIDAPPDEEPTDGYARIIGSIEVSGSSIATDAERQIAVVSGRESGLSVIDLADPMRPRVVGSLDLEHLERAVATEGGFVYVLEGSGDPSQASMAVVDIGNASRPVFATRIALPGQPYFAGIAVEGSYVYAAATSAGLQVIDVSDPRSPRIVGTAPGIAGGQRVDVHRGYAFLTAPNRWIIVDVRNPQSPRVVTDGSLPSEGWAFAGDRLYMLSNSNLRTSDFSNPPSLKILSVLGLQDRVGFRALDATGIGTTVMVATYSGTILVIDAWDPRQPEVTQELEAPGRILRLIPAAEHVLALDDASTLNVISIGR